mmetsp:Transcript_31073/g.53491  ORF Transcript_31073/g.53491 Transcript_31073/m.53491 type:complete len:94 (-) Transcript_31073:11-292(-)
MTPTWNHGNLVSNSTIRGHEVSRIVPQSAPARQTSAQNTGDERTDAHTHTVYASVRKGCCACACAAKSNGGDADGRTGGSDEEGREGRGGGSM